MTSKTGSAKTQVRGRVDLTQLRIVSVQQMRVEAVEEADACTAAAGAVGRRNMSLTPLPPPPLPPHAPHTCYQCRAAEALWRFVGQLLQLNRSDLATRNY